MKRIALSIMAVVCVLGAIAALGQFSGPVRIDETCARPPVYQVIGSNAAAKFRHGGPNVWLCDGTISTGGDQVELQAAITAIQATTTKVGEIVVHGSLYVSKPANAPTEYVCTGAAWTDSTETIDYSGGSWSTGAETDVAVGDLVRFYDGADAAGGEDLLENHDECIATVTAVDTGADTITFADGYDQLASMQNYTTISFKRQVAAIRISSGNIRMSGVSFQDSKIILANDQDCDIIHVDPLSADGGHNFSMRRMTLDGNHIKQGDDDDSVYDRACNGLVINNEAGTTFLRRVWIGNCKGDALLASGVNRLELDHCWLAWNTGGGLYVSGELLRLGYTDFYENGGPALVAKHLNDSTLMFRRAQTNADAHTRGGVAQSEYVAKIFDCNRLKILNSAFIDAKTNSLGCIFLDRADECIVSNCTFDEDDSEGGTARACVKFSANVSRECLITNNTFDSALPSPVQSAASWAKNNHKILNNVGQRESTVTDYVRAYNDSGAEIALYDVVVRLPDGDGDSAYEIAGCSINGDPRVLGVCTDVAIANATRGNIQTRGQVAYVKVDDGENIAIGDELCAGDVASHADEAAAGDTVFAIALEADGAGTPGATSYVACVLVEHYVHE